MAPPADCPAGEIDPMRQFLISLLAFTFLSRAAASNQLAEQLRPVLQAFAGDVAVAVKHLETGEQYHWRADAVQPTASLIKLAVMVTAYRQADQDQLDLQQHITLQEGDKVPGSGILTEHFSAGATISVRDAVRLMIGWSDNTATNLVIDRIGLRSTADTMQSLGFHNTLLHSKVYRRDTSAFPDRSRQFGLGSTTAAETVRLLEQLYNGTIASPASCEQMIEHLLACDDDSKLAGELPRQTRFAHKTGAVNATRCDAGIIYSDSGPIAICVLTTNNEDTSWAESNAAHQLCGRVGRIVYDYFNPVWRQENEDKSGPLAQGSHGTIVEMLQRTLNQRLQPPPQLSVDGDFGPATAGAVRVFQTTVGLEATGVADAETLRRLGPLVDEDVVLPPEQINSARLPVRPADPLRGPPWTTCRGWCLLDASTGTVLGGHDARRPLDIASTTKLMTAWVILNHAADYPEVLDEVVTMSERADKVVGSTSAVRAGEQLTVREALYGLLLPSGNDMSVALAEHFGHRLAGPATSMDEDPVPLFVDAMNSEATRLQMNSTQFRNPHGLSADGHRSTCFDLAILARTAWQNPLLRQYVRTRQRGAIVTGAAGYQRNLIWKNTNRLLQIAGYDGIKTGTTSRAGACLISTAERDGQRLILVVLGSASSQSRYIDSRNLYRWGWQQLDRQRTTQPVRRQ
jgi:D-alanyl-D-alanine carboxypeptidase (penicillin-binding protein 5/6)